MTYNCWGQHLTIDYKGILAHKYNFYGLGVSQQLFLPYDNMGFTSQICIEGISSLVVTELSKAYIGHISSE